MSISKVLVSKLSDKKLLHAAGFVAGEWINLEDEPESFEIINPANGEVIATLPNLGVEHTKAAIDSAYDAQKSWSQQTGKERSILLKKLYQLLLDHLDDLATILTHEMGKPLAEARGEILYGASYVEWFSEEAKRTYGDVIPSPDVRVVAHILIHKGRRRNTHAEI